MIFRSSTSTYSLYDTMSALIDPRMITYFVQCLYKEDYHEVKRMANSLGMHERYVLRELMYAALIVNDPLGVHKICNIMEPIEVKMFLPLTLSMKRYECLSVMEDKLDIWSYDDRFAGFLEWKLAQI